MKKLFTLIAMAAMAMGVNAQTLIDYPTSKTGITFSGTTTEATVKIHTNTDAVDCYKLANGYTTDNAYNENSINLEVEGGFKAGDVITIAGAINNSDESKWGTVVVFTLDGTTATPLKTFDNFINSRLVADEPGEQSYTLEADADKLYLGRSGNTATNVTLIKVVRQAPAAETQVWTLVGVGPLCGSAWDLNDESNLMTTTDGVNYTLVKEDAVLEGGVAYEYKAAKDKSWDVSVPQSGNQSLTVSETGKYKVTFTLNVETGTLTAEAVKTGEAEIGEKTYSVIGSFKGDTWTIDYDLVKGADGLYTVVIDGVDAGNYEFKVRENHDWTMSYPNSNYKITVDADGSAVTVTFNAETKEITAVAGTTKVNAVKAEKAGVKYNLAGRKVNAQYKGIVIENGRKVLK